MTRLELPAVEAGAALAFADAEGARNWLCTQPKTLATQTDATLLAQLKAVDASTIGAAERIAILDVLRGEMVRAAQGLESRYARKPLPPAPDAAEALALASRLWRTLAVAYLRPVPLLPAADAALPLHRAAVALRMEQMAHILAGLEVPAALHRLLYGILALAEGQGVQRSPVMDPDFAFLGESHIAGHVAWCLLLEAVDPYRLSAAQLAVANRAFSRWRELAAFQAQPDDDPKARTLSLERLLPGVDLPEGAPRWLDVRPVVRKMRKRVEALEAGETPESLKLGRELSAAGCVALMELLERALADRPAVRERSHAVALAFGPEDAYVAIERRPLNPSEMDASSGRSSHERMAVFGFNNVANLASAVVRVEAATESWQLSGERVRRQGEGGRRLGPCLVALASERPGHARLGVLGGLRVAADGSLEGRLRWYAERPVAARLRSSGPAGARGGRVPAFLLGEDDGEYSLVVSPTAGMRAHTGIALEDSPVEHLLLGEVIERGSDFVRFSCRAN